MPDAAPAHPLAIVIVIYPDVREMPAPTPFQSVARLDAAVDHHPTVQIHGVPAVSLRSRVAITPSTPPFPGVKSKESNGMSFPIASLADGVVATGDQPLVRRGTIFGMNSTGPRGLHNTEGIVVYVISNGQGVILDDGSFSGDMAPPLRLPKGLSQIRSFEELEQWTQHMKEHVRVVGAEIARDAQYLEDNYQFFTRAGGALETVGGGIEAFVGGNCVWMSGGIGAVLGCGLLTMHGLDHVQAGVQTAYGGRHVATLTYQGTNNAALYAGYSEVASHRMALFMDGGPTLLTPSGATGLTKLSRFGKLPSRGAKVGAGAKGVRIGPKPVIDDASLEWMRAHGLTEDSVVFRNTQGKYLDTRTMTASAPPRPMALVRDIHNPQRNPIWDEGLRAGYTPEQLRSTFPEFLPPEIRASSLGPGFNVSLVPNPYDGVSTTMRLGDLLAAGGRIYPDVSGATGVTPFLVTIPGGGSVPFKFYP